jgi:hypothetical protein
MKEILSIHVDRRKRTIIKYRCNVYFLYQIRFNMTSKHPRRHPLKRVRPDNENQGSISSSNGRSNKKFCRQSSEGLF